MTLRHPPLLKLIAPAVVFAALLAVLALVNRAETPPTPAATLAGDPTSTEQRAEADARRGDAYLQRVRDTGDAALYTRAERSFDSALRRDPRNVTAVIGAGTLALARHDFREGLRLGERALSLAPATVRPYAVIVDAQIELGRYDEAERSLQRMVDLRPNLASYARVSYFRELNGDLRGAAQAMSLAVSAGGGTPENVAYVQSLLGDLALRRGRVGAAASAYRQALRVVGDHPPALIGLARVEVARGDLDAASMALRRAGERGDPVTLTEIELARGRKAAAAIQIEKADAQHRQELAQGAHPDPGMAEFEADHGSRRRAVTLGRRIYAEAPSVEAADALGWALTRAGRSAEGLRMAREALRLGSRDPSFHYHAGITAAAAGRPAMARRELRRALAPDPSFSPYHAARARRELRRLGGM
jgi:tetratricopeptide (TPR) repeat protein